MTRAEGVFRDTAAGVGKTTWTFAIGLATVPVLVAKLGMAGYGTYASLQLLGVTGLLGSADLGIQNGIARFIGAYQGDERPDRTRRLVRAGFLYFAVVAVVISAALVLSSKSIALHFLRAPLESRSEYQFAVVAVAVGFLFQFPGLVLRAYFVGSGRLARLRGWEAVERTVGAMTAMAMAISGFGIAAIVMAEQAVLFVALVAMAASAAASDRGSFVGPGGPPADTKSVIALGSTVFASKLGYIALQMLPDVLVAAILGPAAIAAYTVAKKMPLALKTLQSSLNSAVFAMAVQSDEGNSIATAHRAVRAARLLLLLVTPVCVMCAALSERLLVAWAGPAFAPFAWLATGLLLAHLPHAFTLAGVSGLTELEQLRRGLPYSIVPAVALVIGLPWILSSYGLFPLPLVLFAAGACQAVGVAASISVGLDGASRLLWHSLIAPVLLGAAATAVPAFLAHWLVGPSVISLIAWSLLSGSIGLAGTLLLGLSAQERSRLLGSVSRRFHLQTRVIP